MPPSPPNSEIDGEFDKVETYFLENDLYEDELIPEDKLPSVTIFHVANCYNSINARLNQSSKRPLSQNSLNSSQHRRHKNHDKLYSKRTCENGLSIKTKKHKSSEIGRVSVDCAKEALSSSIETNSLQIDDLTYRDYDSKSNCQSISSAYDSTMLSALNNGLNSNNRSEKKTIDGTFYNLLG